jgi:hypothetical protein
MPMVYVEACAPRAEFVHPRDGLILWALGDSCIYEACKSVTRSRRMQCHEQVKDFSVTRAGPRGDRRGSRPGPKNTRGPPRNIVYRSGILHKKTWFFSCSVGLVAPFSARVRSALTLSRGDRYRRGGPQTARQLPDFRETATRDSLDDRPPQRLSASESPVASPGSDWEPISDSSPLPSIGTWDSNSKVRRPSMIDLLGCSACWSAPAHVPQRISPILAVNRTSKLLPNS